MPVPMSSLSVAVQGIADYLDSQFGEEVNITVTNPQKASEIAKGAAATAHCLNLFAYRVAPAGFQPDLGSDQTQFIRLNALITPFPADLTDAADDVDLRILGHALRVLQSHPVLPIGGAPLPGDDIPQPRKDYRLEAILLSPPMEEVNHIWTTQGGELAYRLSAVYEFALIPIEPLEPRVEATPPETLMIDTHVDMSGAELTFNPVGDGSQAIPLGDAPPVNWLPIQMGVSGDSLTNQLSVTLATTLVTVAVIGPPNESAALTVVWTLDDDSESSQSPQILAINATSFDDANSQNTISITVPATAVTGVIQIQAAEAGAPIPDSAFGNTISMAVTS